MKISICADYDLNDIVDQIISELTCDELVELVKYIDRGLVNWDFTKVMYAYFENEMSKFDGDM